MLWEIVAVMMVAGFLGGPVVILACAGVFKLGKKLINDWLRWRSSDEAALAWVNARYHR